ncbi:MAG: DUF1800 domain-containing protein [Gammaproteobacteria bacterium]|nr:DUF1800 domain-containing protein [Gammaproteobacteria bacterium]
MRIRTFLGMSTLILVVACGGGGGSSDSKSSSVASTAPVPQRGASDSRSEQGVSDVQAARFLTQATFGPTYADIAGLLETGRDQWLADQLAMPPTYHRPLMLPNEEMDNYWQIHRIEAWWKAALRAPDQLRQRMAFALSEIFVISDHNGAVERHSVGMTHYYDRLLEHAFGNYRDLLEAVTLHPMMGRYLSHLGNEKANVEKNIRPDENYAREVMQLFTIGLVELNLDGTEKSDAQGRPIPTYDQETIENFARVFTGWTFAQSSSWLWPAETASMPMEAWPWFHDDGEKTLLQGEVVPAGLSPEEDLERALDNLFYHPNVPPFISKQLIQRFVTSNPTPAYVERVARVFVDNGQGERGDLGAVIQAILLDDEALAGTQALPNQFGKLREPLIQTAHVWRNLDARSNTDRLWTWQLYKSHGQGPLQSPSVFNFFRPDYTPPGEILMAPELQMYNDSLVISQLNEWMGSIVWAERSRNEDNNDDNRILVHTDQWEADYRAHGGDELLDRLNLVFFSGQLSGAELAIYRAALTEMEGYDWLIDSEKITNLIFMMVTSPQYQVQQ